MSPSWPDEVDEVLGGDQAIALGYSTPARGVVVTPVTNFPIRDREAGTLTAVNTSVGTWRKLDRIRREPRVALAYHTRAHGRSERPEYVLVHGTASLSEPIARYPDSIRDHWEPAGGPVPRNPLWRLWLRAFDTRVAITVAVERIVVWPELGCRGAAAVHGTPLPADPPAPQRAPRGGTEPRIDHERAARRAQGLPNVLLGWLGADGYPMIVPVDVSGVEERGMLLEPPPGLVPPGGRRAGLVAHRFRRYTSGQVLRKHTGWLDAGERVVYAPHTERGYHMPPGMFVFRLAAGAGTWAGMRGARRAGFVPR